LNLQYIWACPAMKELTARQLEEKQKLRRKADNLAYQQRNFEEALTCYTKALRMDPSDMSLRDSIADSFSSMYRDEEALEYTNRTLALEKDRFDSLFRKVGILTNLRRVSECEQVVLVMERAATADVASQLVMLDCKANVYDLLGRTEEALCCINQALEKTTQLTCYKTEWEISLVKCSIGMYLDLQLYEKALELCSLVLDSPIKAYWNAAAIRKMEILYYMGRYEEGLTVVNMVTLERELCRSIMHAVLLAAHTKDRDSSLKIVEFAASLFSKGKASYFDNHFYLVYAGRVFDLFGQDDKAFTFYCQALAMYTNFRQLSQWHSDCQQRVQQKILANSIVQNE